MASTSKNEERKHVFIDRLTPFPSVINGRINLVQFLEAASGLILIVERFGAIIAHVKHDIQGNVDKIRAFYHFDKDSCLLECMVKEDSRGLKGPESVLWLNRAMLFFEIALDEIISHLKLNNDEPQVKSILNVAYEGSLKKHHSIIKQQLSNFVFNMSPTFQHILKAMEVEDVREFEHKLTNYNKNLRLVRCTIDDYFKENNLFQEPL